MRKLTMALALGSALSTGPVHAQLVVQFGTTSQPGSV